MTRQNFFAGKTLVEGADPNTFESIEHQRFGSIIKDVNHVYVNSLLLEEADPNTFEKIESGYYRDKDTIFVNQGFEGIQLFPLDHIDASSFEILGGGYVRDKDSVYYRIYNKLKNVDVATFSVMEDTRYTEDANGVYFDGILLDQYTQDGSLPTGDSVGIDILLNGGYISCPGNGDELCNEVPESFIDTSDWEVYSDTEFGISIAYPNNNDSYISDRRNWESNPKEEVQMSIASVATVESFFVNIERNVAFDKQDGDIEVNDLWFDMTRNSYNQRIDEYLTMKNDLKIVLDESQGGGPLTFAVLQSIEFDD